MSRRTRLVLVIGSALAVMIVVVHSPNLFAKRTPPLVDPNNPTRRLFEFLDDSRAGKPADFYVIADTFADTPDSNSSAC